MRRSSRFDSGSRNHSPTMPSPFHRPRRPKDDAPLPSVRRSAEHTAECYRIGAWRDSPTVIGAGIRWQRRTRYQHVGLIRPDQSIVEATWPRVTDEHFLNPGDSGVDFFTFRSWTGWDEDHWRALDDGMSREIGCGYDLGGVLNFLTKWREKEDRKWFCSELLAQKVADVCLAHDLPFEGLQARIAPQYMDPYTCVQSLALERFQA